ncbi:unnamed protein product [Rotaria socialis]|uniref:Myb-binding protein 1A n=1 Tax=Rotaria socialis TaxID=392032 RepID=A0A817WP36_9BILA|nr:unnamed protein product [Rotaria socialis]CAF3358239.1 unnamed protein product [Rotaria socialis]CAF3370492.1 unnamed protein product [Rotaria socialis]CAF3710788.1 unnamed protein product [Rotaria socialis]CAF4105693.1 unnamed protein product [Rotaria socialis]
MDVYWELSDFDIHTRQQGMEKLLNSLKTWSTDENNDTNSSSQIDYSISRLIKGLVSNRKCARIGYAASLGTLAHLNDDQLKIPSVDDFVSLVQNKLTTKKEAGVEDAKNVRIGRVLSYIALAYTQKDNDLSKLLPQIISDLLLMRTQETRRRLRAFVDASIVQLAKWSGRKLFKNEILPHIQELFPTNWQIGDDGAKSLFLLVSLSNLYPKLFDQNYFKTYWKVDMLPLGKTKDQQITIKKCLQSFDNELHLLQQLSQELLVYAVRTQQLALFWPVLVDELSNIGFDSNKGHILLDLLTFCFQDQEISSSIYTIETILDNSSELFTKILDLLSSSGRKMHQPASIVLSKNALEKLAHTIASRPLQERLRLFEKLLNCANKNYACINSVANAVSEKLTIDELSDYVKFIIGLFCDVSKDDENALHRRRHFLLEMLSNLCNCSTFDLKNSSCGLLFENMLGICVLLSNFKLNNHIPKEFREFLHGNIEISDVTREHIEDITYKFLMYEFHENKYEHGFNVFQKSMNWLSSMKHYTPLFKNVEEIKTYLDEYSKELFQTIQGNKIQSLPDEKLRLAFQQVFVLSFYDLCVDFNRAKQYLDDLVTCVKNAHTQIVLKKKIKEESSWIEVFIDILLSMDTKKQHDIRSIVKKIYHQIASYVSEDALKLMLQTITIENESDDDDEDEDDDEDGDDENEDESNDEQSDIDEDDELLENGDVNEDLRKAVEKALGDAAVKDDEEDDVDMDDEAMLRLDPLIAEAFRSQLRKSSNIKIINEKLHHQFRVLDLIESVIKKDERMRFVLISIRPLIETLTSLPNTSAYKTMIERIDSILCHLSNRKIGHSDMPTTDECMELFRYLASLAGSRAKLTTDTLSKISMFVIKLSLNVGKLEDRLAGVEETILTTYESGFLRFLQPNTPKQKSDKVKKKNKDDDDDDEPAAHQSVVHPTIIKEFFLRFPEYGTRLMLLMVQTALKETVNWKKRNIVCGTLNNFFNKKQLDHADEQLLKATIHLLVKMCNDPKSSKIESLHVITVLTQKLLLIRNPTLTEQQASELLAAVSVAIKVKPIHSDKQRKQLLNLIQSFKKRFSLKINEEIMNVLTTKRKASSITITNAETNNQPKKMKTKNQENLSNGDNKESIVDCRQIPFQGINVKT